MLIDTISKDPINGHIDFIRRGHYFMLRIREVPVYPFTSCSLASTMEAAFMADFPSSDGDQEPSKDTIRQSCGEDGMAIISSKSRGTVVNVWG